MLYRKAYSKLLQWRSDPDKKALCVTGARQIGKTTLIRQFAKENYKHFFEINFVTSPDAAKIFSGDLDKDTLIANLTAFARHSIPKGETLIFLDEIQECPQARTAIKFLVEDGRFDYIESGSLLGVCHNDVKSFPVGFEEIYRMYPMDFEEFAYANGVQRKTIDYLFNCFQNKTPVSEAIHAAMTKLFYLYMVVGGMPEAVQIYVKSHDVARVVNYQKSILNQYRQDIAKYADNVSKPKIRAIFDSIPSQLNDKKRRFYINSIGKNARFINYDNSFRWLEDAAAALSCYNVTEPSVPLRLNEKHSLFKLFMNDTGLLCAASPENIQLDLLNGNVEINMGSILENVVAQQLTANGFRLNYFDSKRYGEVDFVLQNGKNIVMLEVKSGKDFRQHKALDNMLNASWKVDAAYVLCRDNIKSAGRICYLPWYMSLFFRPEQLPDEFHYEPDLSAIVEQ